MSDEDSLDPRTLTFSQANGYDELPQPLKLEELNDSARTKLWSLLYAHVSNSSLMGVSLDDIGERVLCREWRTILSSLHVELNELPLDEFDHRLDIFVDEHKQLFLNAPFNRVFDFLQGVMRHQECPTLFTGAVARVFEQCRLAYVVDVHPPATIFPATSEEEGAAILQAVSELTNARLAGAVTHLRYASDCISQGDFAGAVRESIHAVESTARQIDPNARTLEPALRALEKAGELHPALKKAFSNLYGYTSDEQGIRHALIDNPQPNVGQDEAVFMLGACASFSSYLARKRHTSTS